MPSIGIDDTNTFELEGARKEEACGGWIKKEGVVLEGGKWGLESVEEECRMGMGRWDEIESDMKQEKLKRGSIEVGEVSKDASPRKGVARGLSIMDFILRIITAVATLGSALAMGTTNETLPFATQFIKFRAEFDDLPSLV